MATADEALTRREFHESMKDFLSRREFYDATLPSLATKEDLALLQSRLTWRIFWAQAISTTALGAVITAVVAVLKFVE